MQKRISMDESTTKPGAISSMQMGISPCAAVSRHQLPLAALRSSAGGREQSTQAPSWGCHSERRTRRGHLPSAKREDETRGVFRGVLCFETSVSARGTFEIGFHLFGLGFFFLPAFGRFFLPLFGFSYFSNDIRKIGGGNGAEVLDDLRGLACTSVQLLKQSLFNYQHLSATVLKGCVMIPSGILDRNVKRLLAAVIEGEKVKTILPFVEKRR